MCECVSVHTNINWVGHAGHSGVKVHNVRWVLAGMKVSCNSLQSHTHTHNKRETSTTQTVADRCQTCTNVVFPDPAIPRKMIHVGLSAISTPGLLESGKLELSGLTAVTTEAPAIS